MNRPRLHKHCQDFMSNGTIYKCATCGAATLGTPDGYSACCQARLFPEDLYEDAPFSNEALAESEQEALDHYADEYAHEHCVLPHQNPQH